MPSIALSRPAAGQRMSVLPTPGANISIDFDPAQTTLERTGNDLNFTFDDGASINITGFYSDYTKDNVPDFEIDGNLIAGKNFFDAFAPDLMPAAGPAATAERSSRYTEHGDSSLQGGLNHLDGLDYNTQGSAANGSDLQADPLQTGALIAGGLSTLNPGEDPTPMADVRAVLYSAGSNSGNHFVSTPVFFRDADGNLLNLSSGAAITRISVGGPDSIGVGYSHGTDSSWLELPAYTDDQLVFKFSAAGLAQLQTLAPDTFLRCFVTVTVVKDGHTFEYVVEVVATGGSSFDSAAYDAQYGAVSRLGTESVGEYHQGSGQAGSYQIIASTGDDNIVLNDSVIGGSWIHTSGSSDPSQRADDYNTIRLNAGIANTTPGSITQITSTDGILTVEGSVTVQGSGTENFIDMGKGQVHVHNASGVGIVANGGDNIILGGEATVNAHGTGLVARGGGSNSITTSGGIDISAQSTSGGTRGLMAGELGGNATNSLKAGGDINITAAGNGTSASAIDNNSGNTTHVESTGGDVTLKATSTSSGVGGIWGIGSTTVTAGKNLTIETSTQGAAEAGGVHTGGTTTLTALDGDVTVRAEGDIASSLYTISTGTTTVSASGLVDIQAHGRSGSYYIHGGNATALYAESQNPGQLARNIIEGREVSITADTLQSGDTYALYSKAALNTITSDTLATVTAENHGSGNARGMYATSTNNKLGANEITGHDVTVSSSAVNGNAYAMQASSTTGDSANTVTLTGGTADISAASDHGNAYAMRAEGRATNTITGSGDVTLTGTAEEGSGCGMYAAASGSNSITTSGDVSVTGSGYRAAGVNADQNATNTINADGGIDINAQATSGGTWGLMAGVLGGNAANRLKAGGDINITAAGNGTSASAIDNNSGNTTHVESTGGDVTLKATSTSSGVGGIWGIGSTTVTAGKNLTIETSTQGAADAGGVHTGGTTTLTALDGDVTIRAEGNKASGINTASTGTTTVSASGLVDIQAHGRSGNATALYAESQNPGQLARNIIEGREVSITAETLQSGDTYALYSKAALNTITSDTQATVTAENHGSGNARGMYATSTNNKLGANEITGHDVTVSSTAVNGDAYAMQASSTTGDSANTVTLTGGTADISAASAQGNAYAMYASGSGSNSISTEGGNIAISSNASTGRSDGMHAEASGSNSIITESDTVNVDAHSSSGATVGVGADAFTVNGVNTITANTIVAGEVAISSSSDSAWTVGMYAANNNTTNHAENSIDTTGAAARGASGNVSIHANWDDNNGILGSYEAHAMAAYGKNAVNSIAAYGDVNVKAGSSGNVANGLIARYGGDNVIDGQNDIRIGAVSATHQAAGLRADTGGHNSLTAQGAVDISVTGATASGMTVASLSGSGYLVSGSNTISSDGKTTLTATATGSAADANAYGMAINYNTGVSGDASNTITSGDDVVIKSSSNGGSAYGMAVLSSGSATDSAVNTIKAGGNIEITAEGKGATAAMYATGAHAANNILADGGNVSLVSTSAENSGTGMHASLSGSNSISTEGGHVTVTAREGLAAADSGINTITAQGGSIEVISDRRGTGASASDGGSNTITGTDDATVSVINTSKGLVAQSGGTNTISAEDGKISVDATNTGLQAKGAGSSNVITGKDIDIIAQTSASDGLLAEAGGKNRVESTGGDVALSGGNVLQAHGTGSENTLTVHNGSIEFNSWAGWVPWSSAYSLYYSDSAMYAVDGGVNAITGSGGTNISFTGQAAGLKAHSGSNSVTTDGDVTFSGITMALDAHRATGGNTLRADNIVIDSKVYADRNLATVNALSGGSNTLAASPDGAIKITTSAATNSKRDPYSTSINDMVSVKADGAGSHNSLSAGEISIENQCGMGLSATSGGKNTLESASGSPLTVTITASADTAEKAIAMWAQGGGSVNYITGHSQAGGMGDNIILNATTHTGGQGVAMQTAGGGKNIITTGAGNDRVTINGAVQGSGNEINLGGGDNILTVNGMVQSGSLNVIAAGGSYTLILQASDTQSFASRYGQWLNSIASNDLIANGLASINFEGLDPMDLPTDFLAAFNDLLYGLRDSGIDIQPQDLVGLLHNPAVAPSSMMLMAEDAVEHGGTDSIHAATGDTGHDAPGQADSHALDEAGNSAAVGSGVAEQPHIDDAAYAQDASGQEHHAEHGPSSVEPAVADATADGMAHSDLSGQNGLQNVDAQADADDTASLLHAAGHDASSVLDDLLSDPSFYGSEDVGLLYHEDNPHQGAVGSVADGAGNTPGEIHADILLVQGDESLDSLFAGSPLGNGENGDTHQYGESAASAASVGLTDMPAAMAAESRTGSGMSTHGDGGASSSIPGESASAPAWESVQPATDDSSQDAANTAMRQMEIC